MGLGVQNDLICDVLDAIHPWGGDVRFHRLFFCRKELRRSHCKPSSNPSAQRVAEGRVCLCRRGEWFGTRAEDHRVASGVRRCHGRRELWLGQRAPSGARPRDSKVGTAGYPQELTMGSAFLSKGRARTLLWAGESDFLPAVNEVVQEVGQGIAFGCRADQGWHEGAIRRTRFVLVEHRHDVADRRLVPFPQ